MGLGLLRGQPQPPGRAVAEQAVAARGDAELHLQVADEFRFMGPLAIVECAHLILFWWRPLLSGPPFADRWRLAAAQAACAADHFRSEEHTSELQSLMRISYAVFCLKKKK